MIDRSSNFDWRNFFFKVRRRGIEIDDEVYRRRKTIIVILFRSLKVRRCWWPCDTRREIFSCPLKCRGVAAGIIQLADLNFFLRGTPSRRTRGYTYIYPIHDTRPNAAFQCAINTKINRTLLGLCIFSCDVTLGECFARRFRMFGTVGRCACAICAWAGLTKLKIMKTIDRLLGC